MSLLQIGNVPVGYDTSTPADAPSRREHCKVSADVAAALGIHAGLPRPVQVRLQVAAADTSRKPRYGWFAGASAVFTVAGIASGRRTVRLHSDSAAGAVGGVRKLFHQGSIPHLATVTLRSVAPGATTLDGVATEHFAGDSAWRYFAEHARTGSRRLLISAPHGGEVERGTSAQLEELRLELVGLGVAPAVWECRGEWGNGEAHRRWHVASRDLDESAFPGLGHLVSAHGGFEHAVALHGFRWDEDPHDASTHRRGIVLGGRAPRAHKEAIRQEIAAAAGARRIAFFVADPAGSSNHPGADGDLGAFPGLAELGGLAPDDLVNRLSAAGLQIEQSLGVRLDPALAGQVARASARVMDDVLAGDGLDEAEPAAEKEIQSGGGPRRASASRWRAACSGRPEAA